VPLNLSPGALAKAMGVPRTRVERIAAETSGISADTALRLSKVLGTSAQLWLNLQNRFDIEMAERVIGKKLGRIVRVTRLLAISILPRLATENDLNTSST
jgi:addiction module HigA family antidote